MFLAESEDKQILNRNFGGLVPGATFRYIVTNVDDQ